ncbi:MAG: hypothetical protein Q4D79_02785 [Propionibacteriaceae bacterium]|nr:hypothetical protein [Propionibacteriaceae bacterium]
METYSADSDEQPSSRPSPLAELTEAIKRVRTEGVNKPGLRIPAPLGRALGIDSNPQAAVARVRQALLSYAIQLPRARRLAFLYGAGFRQDIRGSSGQRVTMAAEALGLSRRNVYLQIHRASEAIAAELLRNGQGSVLAETDVITSRTDCSLDLRSDAPAIRLSRTVIVLRDGIDTFEETFYFPGLKGRDLKHLALSGCQIASAEATSDAWRLQLALPAPLHVGETHTSTVWIELPSRDALVPMLVFSPLNPRQRNTIELTFGEQRPRVVERFEHVWTSQATNPGFPATPIPVTDDPVVVEFPEMEQGWDYGVRWFW